MIVAVNPAAAAAAEYERAGVIDDGGWTPAARPGSPQAARSSIGRGRLKAELKRAFGSVAGAKGAWVFDTGSGQRALLYAKAKTTPRLIASNTKLFTTGAFLDRFGADGRLRTKVYEAGKRRGPQKGTLKGDLVLVGDGDPALATPDFARRNGVPLTSLGPLARAIKSAGIRRVKGDVRADDTIFDRARSVRQPGITGGPYLSTLSGLSFDAGFANGQYASDPALRAARKLIARLRKEGVKVRGEAVIGRASKSLAATRPLGTVDSPTVARLIQETNTPSDNFYAEMLLKRLAAGNQRQGTTAGGASRAKRFARKVGSGVSMVNGSGLSRSNKSSPRQIGKLLVRLAGGERERARAFRDSLAVAGRTGTLANRMRGTAAEGHCQAKTGTLDGVSALSGYCQSSGDPVVFSILMNGPNVESARRAQDTMVAAIARYR